MQKASHISKSPQDTINLAVQLTKQLKAGDIVLLEGELGAGKTTFVKGIAQGLKAKSDDVTSPTFVLMNIYKGQLPIYHFDLYRLGTPQELDSLNLDEYLDADGVTIIEWPKRLGSHMPENMYWIEFKHKDENTREICISYPLKLQQKSSH